MTIWLYCWKVGTEITLGNSTKNWKKQWCHQFWNGGKVAFIFTHEIFSFFIFHSTSHTRVTSFLRDFSILFGRNFNSMTTWFTYKILKTWVCKNVYIHVTNIWLSLPDRNRHSNNNPRPLRKQLWKIGDNNTTCMAIVNIRKKWERIKQDLWDITMSCLVDAYSYLCYQTAKYCLSQYSRVQMPSILAI